MRQADQSGGKARRLLSSTQLKLLRLSVRTAVLPRVKKVCCVSCERVSLPNMSERQPRALPGFVYDPETRRYFKDSRTLDAVVPRKRQRREEPLPIAQAPNRPQSDILTSVFDIRTSPHPSRGRRRFTHAALTAPAALKSDAPDCLTLGGTITSLDISDTIRIGSSDGLVASGQLGAGWRLEWLLGSSITSIRSSSDRFVATSFGPNAAAVFATASEATAMASITLRPRKTSIWTSSLSNSLLALGCDSHVLATSDPVSARMDTIELGTAVYALEQGNHGRIVQAGCRSGAVHNLDLRTAQRQPVLIRHTAITCIKLVDQFGLLVASMDGQLILHDLRALPAPLLTFSGHVNKTQLQLGIASGHGLVAAAGQDCRVKLWDLRDGQQIGPRSRPPYAPEQTGLLNTVYDEPIPALAFDSTSPALLLANGATLERHELCTYM